MKTKNAQHPEARKKQKIGRILIFITGSLGFIFLVFLGYFWWKWGGFGVYTYLVPTGGILLIAVIVYTSYVSDLGTAIELWIVSTGVLVYLIYFFITVPDFLYIGPTIFLWLIPFIVCGILGGVFCKTWYVETHS